MAILIPAILERKKFEVLAKIQLLQGLGVKVAHLDVMDGEAVSNSCYGDVSFAKRLEIGLEVHLMVKNPLQEAREWLQLPNVTRVIVRGEEVHDWVEYSNLSAVSKKLGVAFDPDADVHEALMQILHLDYFLVMGVRSGFSGQQFNARALGHIWLIKRLFPSVTIGVDGGMNEETIPLVISRGANVINAASYFWAGDMKEKIAFVEGF